MYVIHHPIYGYWCTPFGHGIGFPDKPIHMTGYSPDIADHRVCRFGSAAEAEETRMSLAARVNATKHGSEFGTSVAERRWHGKLAIEALVMGIPETTTVPVG